MAGGRRKKKAARCNALSLIVTNPPGEIDAVKVFGAAQGTGLTQEQAARVATAVEMLGISQDKAATLLHTHGYDLTLAVEAHTSGAADDETWSTTGTSSKQKPAAMEVKARPKVNPEPNPPTPVSTATVAQPVQVVTDRITVPSEHAAAVIGKRGATVQSIQEKTGARVNLEKSGGPKKSGVATVIVRGTAVQVASAIEQVKTVVKQAVAQATAQQAAADGSDSKSTAKAAVEPKSAARSERTTIKSDLSVRERETKALNSQGFEVAASGMRQLDLGQLLAAQMAPQAVAAPRSPASVPFANEQNVSTIQTNNKQVPSTAQRSQLPEEAKLAYRSLDKLSEAMADAWRSAYAEASAAFSSAQSDLVQRQADIMQQMRSAHEKEAALLQGRKQLLDNINFRDPATMGLYQQFNTTTQKDAPRWSSRRLKIDSSALQQVIASHGSVVDPFDPAAQTSRDKSQRGGKRVDASIQHQIAASGDGGSGGGGIDINRNSSKESSFNAPSVSTKRGPRQPPPAGTKVASKGSASGGGGDGGGGGSKSRPQRTQRAPRKRQQKS